MPLFLGVYIGLLLILALLELALRTGLLFLTLVLGYTANVYSIESSKFRSQLLLGPDTLLMKVASCKGERLSEIMFVRLLLISSAIRGISSSFPSLIGELGILVWKFSL